MQKIGGGNIILLGGGGVFIELLKIYPWTIFMYLFFHAWYVHPCEVDARRRLLRNLGTKPVQLNIITGDADTNLILNNAGTDLILKNADTDRGLDNALCMFQITFFLNINTFNYKIL